MVRARSFIYYPAPLGILEGSISPIHHLGEGIWAYVGGLIFDRTGSYRLVFILSAIMALMAVFCSIMIREKRHKLCFGIG